MVHREDQQRDLEVERRWTHELQSTTPEFPRGTFSTGNGTKCYAIEAETVHVTSTTTYLLFDLEVRHNGSFTDW